MTYSGTLFILGGAIRPDHDAIWHSMVGAAGGAGSRFAVIAAASGQAEVKAQRVCERLHHYRAATLTVPLAAEGQLPFSPSVASDANWAAAVATCDAVYLSGGDQGRLRHLLLRSDGSDSLLLAAIRQVFLRGGVIAGSSAGAAVLSHLMLADAGRSLQALQRGLAIPHAICGGLGFAPQDMLIDQHAIARGRYGRMLAAQIATGIPLAAGIDEDTALILQDGIARVCGSGVVLTDIRMAQVNPVPPLRANNVQLSLLRHGDWLALSDWEIHPAEGAKIIPLCSAAKKSLDGASLPDAFDGASLEQISENLIRSPAADCRAKADNDEYPSYEVRFRKTAATRAWIKENQEYRQLSFAGLQLSAEPDTMRSNNDFSVDIL